MKRGDRAGSSRNEFDYSRRGTQTSLPLLDYRSCENFGLRPFIMRSESELLILIFRSAKRMDLLMQSDFAKSDVIKSDLRIR